MIDCGTSRIAYDPVPVVAGPRQILPPNPRRYRITFFPPSGARITLANDPIAADGQGVVLSPNQSPQSFCVEDYGDMITRPWHIFYLPGGTPLGWVENVR